jgi:hypothetical protein
MNQDTNCFAPSGSLGLRDKVMLLGMTMSFLGLIGALLAAFLRWA